MSEEHTQGAPQVNYTGVLAVYLVGLLVGGLYVGMVSPARTVVQEAFGIGDTLGIWMITIYTLFYAALIPVIGNLADRYGRKRTFLACVATFAVGSCACGVSAWMPGAAIGGTPAGFVLLLAGRILQAVGACGMIPVANAEIGATFPEERRGAALGLSAATAAVANVMGAAVGSAVLGLVGNASWGLLFLVAVPICIALMAGAAAFLPKTAAKPSGKLDVAGAVVFVAFVMCLLLTLRNLDYFNLAQSVADPGVWGFAVGAVGLAIAFSRVERAAEAPVFHMEYLHSKPILITMAVSFFVGCTIITMTLIPEFAEFNMGMKAGEGGYYVVAIGVLGMVGPPFAGKLIDRVGVKPVMLFGLVVSALGFVLLATAAIAWPTVPVMVASLCVVGLGMGFTMGAPTNYMVLENTSKEESGAAIGTIALVRQIGTTLAPAMLVGFIGAGTTAGFQSMLLCVVAFNAASALLMLAYKPQKKGC